MRWEVQTKISGGWENVWMVGKKLLTFTTKQDAELELTDFLKDVAEAVKEGNIQKPYHKNEFRIVPVGTK